MKKDPGKQKFSRRARRKSKQSKLRTKKMLKEAAERSGPVEIKYLPGFEPPSER